MTIENNKHLVIESIDGTADRGGWQASGTVINRESIVQYGREANIFLRSEGGGVWEPDYHLALRGSILPQNQTFDRRQSLIPILISTSDVFLENAGLQGIYFTNTNPSTNPHQIPLMNLGRIIKHILNQHTNISTLVPGGWVDISGIDIVNSTSVDVYTVRQTNSIWSAIQAIAENEFYVRYFTKQDKFIYERHPQFKVNPPSPVLTLNASNIAGQPEVQYRNELKLDQVQLYGLTDQGEILRADYPANVGTEGRRQKFTNLRCNSQARLNLLAERAYKFLNRDITLRVSLAGGWGSYLELYDRIAVTYTGTTQNGVEIDWTSKKFWVNNVRVTKVGNFTCLTDLDLEEEVL